MEGGADPVKSYAYALVEDKLNRIALFNSEGEVSTFYERIRAAADLEGRANYLSPDGNVRAVILAKQILVEDENCCLGFWQGE